MTAGKKAKASFPVDCSMVGISRLQIDAATMTTEAKPVNPRCTRFPKPFFRKKTQADPSEVPTKGISRP